ncbi:MAG: HAMP domain-containing histidine kinase [Alphaproteobacteria bacterium]|nr:HAMP domain-containing histidine kinase [Alphaproteobacteria bacterium]
MLRANTLSGRFLGLTLVFVALAQVLILVPSVARFQHDWLVLRLEKAQIAALTLLASEGSVPPALESELLDNAGVFNVVLRRDAVRQLVLSAPLPGPVARTVDLRGARTPELIAAAFATLLRPNPGVLRVIGAPSHDAGLLIEVTIDPAPLTLALRAHALQVLMQSALLSLATAVLLFLAVERMILRPIARLSGQMQAYAADPEDARRIIEPASDLAELRAAETALRRLETDLTAALRQKDRLAQLGTAVAKISHDLRNMLTSAQLFADRIEGSADPAVARAAPKLVGSISRAIALCEATLAFGRAEEPPPRLARLALRPLIEEVFEAEGFGAEGAGRVRALVDVPAGMTLRADPEQIFRVLSNLVRNARQAIEATGRPGTVEISAAEDDAEWRLRVGDDGPGLPERARAHLFAPFQGGVRQGGAGLGLAIAAELVRGHGGRLTLERSDAEGTVFAIRLPKDVAVEA